MKYIPEGLKSAAIEAADYKRLELGYQNDELGDQLRRVLTHILSGPTPIPAAVW
jgi:hypothetical protein